MPTGHRPPLVSPTFSALSTPAIDMSTETRATGGSFNSRQQSQTYHHSHANEFTENTDYDKKWQAKFCVEPKNDVESCCLSFWVPSCMYSKVEWRLREARRDRDPTAWKPKDGCDGTCWAHFALTAFFGVGLALTAIQRARIRAVHDIKGSLIKDAVTVLYCQPCALMQQDRELRARLGERLDYGGKNSEPIIIIEQPEPSIPMRYASPRPEPDIEPPSTTSQIIQQSSSGQQHMTSKDVAADRKKLKKKPSISREPSKNKNLPAIQVMDYTFQELTQTATNNTKGNLADVQHIQAIKRNSMIPDEMTFNNQHRSGKGRDHIDKNCKGKRPQNTINGIPQSSPRNFMLNHPSQPETSHFTILRGKSIAEAQIKHDEAQHDLSNEAGLLDNAELNSTSASPGSSPIVDSEKTLTDCETLIASSFASSSEHTITENTHEGSYVHDFSDCPIDKAMLEKIEREEQEEHQHSLTDCNQSLKTSASTVIEGMSQRIKSIVSKEEQKNESQYPELPLTAKLGESDQLICPDPDHIKDSKESTTCAIPTYKPMLIALPNLGPGAQDQNRLLGSGPSSPVNLDNIARIRPASLESQVRVYGKAFDVLPGLSEANNTLPAALIPREGKHSAQHVLTQVLISRTRSASGGSKKKDAQRDSKRRSSADAHWIETEKLKSSNVNLHATSTSD